MGFQIGRMDGYASPEPVCGLESTSGVKMANFRFSVKIRNVDLEPDATLYALRYSTDIFGLDAVWPKLRFRNVGSAPGGVSKFVLSRAHQV